MPEIPRPIEINLLHPFEMLGTKFIGSEIPGRSVSNNSRLLRQERSPVSSGRLQESANGSTICTEKICSDGKFKKTDNVKNAFDRLRKKEDIKKPLKSFKKTSASMLRDEERFQNIEDLFLGHAPDKISGKHYTKVPGKLLDRAISWLETQYEIPSTGLSLYDESLIQQE
ncbi:hypothetical protein [Rubinisphaera italica]|nr:hypothetical protein [Rubinisphaera italica]